MTPEHRHNFELLSAYLRGPLKGKFDMEYYLSQEYRAECDSVGCVLGHSHLAVTPLQLGESWDRYADRVYGIVASPGAPCRDWLWLFSSKWCATDNTPTGAASRIDYYLAQGSPENTVQQIEGLEPLCY